MSRPIVLSNGEMHVGINYYGSVHDFYYPYVGFENHAAAKHLRHKIGVWVDGWFSWLDDGSWNFSYKYHSKSLIGRTIAKNENMQIMIEFDDAVDAEQSAFLRNVHIINQSSNERTVKLFLHQVFVISNSYYTDTAQYLPVDHAILHYKGQRAFMVNGRHADGRKFDQFCIGLYGIEGHEGAYKDAEDGYLSSNTCEHGSVDSVIGFDFRIKGLSSERATYWIAAGKSLHEACKINTRILNEGLIHRLMITDQYWDKWFKPAEQMLAKIPEDFRQSVVDSLLVAKSHIDKHGGVVASTDTTMLNYSRDSYSFCWPRDGAYVIWPFIRLGFVDEPLAFFAFCKRALQDGGYFMHKQNTDGSLGSSWHPYHLEGGEISQPIQEDETAIVLFVFAQFIHAHNNKKLLAEYYDSFVCPMANFLAGYIDKKTGLPHASYDLWERLYLTTTYTVAVVYGALKEAALLADVMQNPEDSLRWSSAAESIKSASKKLYNSDQKCFNKGIYAGPDGVQVDPTIDMSSLFGVFMFGLFDPSGDEVKDSYQTCIDRLKTSQVNPGLARFVNDEYDRYDVNRVGNPWIVTTLWNAQYLLEQGQKDKALDLLKWAKDRMLATGVLPEQLDPDSQHFISVAPLAWSQAEYVSTALDIFCGDQDA